jgi:4-hydroxy-tetrahydrodipicolinate reductase
MKIALIGYGKMGKAIEKIALERGHTVQLKINHQNTDELTLENLLKCDVAIEFSNPHSVLKNLFTCLNAKIPLVVGTTAWLNNLTEIKNTVDTNNLSFVWASNFSLGANLFFKLNNELATLMNQYVNPHQYNVQVEEIHHPQKLDAPSGTALTLCHDILKNIENKQQVNQNGITTSSIIDNATPKIFNNDIEVNSLRVDDVPGTHTINYFSYQDSIAIKHTAHNRSGFALGAIIAAEKIISTKGFFEFRELLFS